MIPGRSASHATDQGSRLTTRSPAGRVGSDPGERVAAGRRRRSGGGRRSRCEQAAREADGARREHGEPGRQRSDAEQPALPTFADTAHTPRHDSREGDSQQRHEKREVAHLHVPHSADEQQPAGRTQRAEQHVPWARANEQDEAREAQRDDQVRSRETSPAARQRKPHDLAREDSELLHRELQHVGSADRVERLRRAERRGVDAIHALPARYVFDQLNRIHAEGQGAVCELIAQQVDGKAQRERREREPRATQRDGSRPSACSEQRHQQDRRQEHTDLLLQHGEACGHPGDGEPRVAPSAETALERGDRAQAEEREAHVVAAVQCADAEEAVGEHQDRRDDPRSGAEETSREEEADDARERVIDLAGDAQEWRRRTDECEDRQQRDRPQDAVMLGHMAHAVPEAQVILDDVDHEAIAPEQIARHVCVVL